MRANRLRALDPRAIVPRAGAGGIGQDGAPDPALPRAARARRAPQRVVAMTFTRKAASEMRERVIGALRDARDDVPVDSPHRARDARPWRGGAGAWRGAWLVAARASGRARDLHDRCAERHARAAGADHEPPRRLAARRSSGAKRCTRSCARNAGRRRSRATNRGACCSRISTTTPQRSSPCSPRCWPSASSGCRTSSARTASSCVRRSSRCCARRSTPSWRSSTLHSIPVTLTALARCAGQAAEYLRADDAKPELARALERCLARQRLARAASRGSCGMAGTGRLAPGRQQARRPQDDGQARRACLPASRGRAQGRSHRDARSAGRNGRTCSMRCIARAICRPRASPTRTGRPWPRCCTCCRRPRRSSPWCSPRTAPSTSRELTLAALEALGSPEAPSDAAAAPRPCDRSSSGRRVPGHVRSRSSGSSSC